MSLNDSAKPETGPNTFSAKSLDVRNLKVDLDIQLNSKPFIEVEVTGPPDQTKKVLVSQNWDTVLIIDNNSASNNIINSGNRNSVVTTGFMFGSVTIRNSTVRGPIFGKKVFGNKIGRPSYKVQIKVPKGTFLNLSNIFGDSTIGDIEGPLDVNNGFGDITAGSLTNTKIDSTGNNDINISEVNGSLSIRSVGNGDINVKSGEVSHLDIDITGNKDVSFLGHTKTASLSVVGNCDINVPKIDKVLKRRSIGNSDINF